MSNEIVREVKCKRALNRCRIADFSYTLNPYVGCRGNCVYCYASFMDRYHDGVWGTYLDVKTNIHEILEKEVARYRRGKVMFCSVSDPYPVEEAGYRITGECLRILLKNNYGISILTKSTLITKDADILSEFECNEIGMSISFPREEDRKNFEFNTSGTDERIKALKKLSDAGVSTFVMMAPFLPIISEKGLDKLFDELRDAGVGLIYIQRFNPRKSKSAVDRIIREQYGIDDYYSNYVNKESYSTIKPKLLKMAENAGIMAKVFWN